MCVYIYIYIFFFFSLKYWANQLGDELWQLGHSVTKANEMKAVSKLTQRNNSCMQLCHNQFGGSSGVDGRIILKWILKKLGEKVLIQFI
jgi:hypothetical protein